MKSLTGARVFDGEEEASIGHAVTCLISLWPTETDSQAAEIVGWMDAWLARSAAGLAAIPCGC